MSDKIALLNKRMAEMTMREFDALPRDWREAIAHSPYGEFPMDFDMYPEEYLEEQEETRQWMQEHSAELY